MQQVLIDFRNYFGNYLDYPGLRVRMGQWFGLTVEVND